VMSTLGFGDVTFEGDLGRAFALIVLLTGIVYMLVLFPFTFIQFFYAPWMEAQSENRAPRQLPKHTSGHILITHYDEVTAALIAKLDLYNYEYYLIVPEISEALRLVDNGIVVVVGDLDDPEAYRNMRVEEAALATSEHLGCGADIFDRDLYVDFLEWLLATVFRFVIDHFGLTDGELVTFATHRLDKDGKMQLAAP